ncbi:MAG: hypothetical protein J6Y60_09755 [Treponema sp.]|nr:hypothetical protein [Treponema sp.]
MLFLILILGVVIAGLITSIRRLHAVTKDSTENQSKRHVYEALMIVCIVFLVLISAVTIFLCWLCYSISVNGM